MIRLDSIADFEMTVSPVAITRENRVRITHVIADAADGYTASDLQNELNRALDEYLVLPENVFIEQTGR